MYCGKDSCTRSTCHLGPSWVVARIEVYPFLCLDRILTAVSHSTVLHIQATVLLSSECTSLPSSASRSWHPLRLPLQVLQLFRSVAIVATTGIITSDLQLQVLSMVAASAKISEKPERVQMINQPTPWEWMAFAFIAIFTSKYIEDNLTRTCLTFL